MAYNDFKSLIMALKGSKAFRSSLDVVETER